MGAGLSERLDRAATWDDLEAAFAEQGLSLEAKGSGLVIGDASSYTKLSALGLTSTAKDFERRFGSAYVEQPARQARTARPWFAVDAIDIVKALTTLGLADKSDVRQAIDETNIAREERLSAAPLATRLMHDLRKSLAASTNLSKAKGVPQSARPPRAKPTRSQRER